MGSKKINNNNNNIFGWGSAQREKRLGINVRLFKDN
jgi:hypothetical protein